MFIAPDGKPRCDWVSGAPEFLAYHDTEWGFPVHDDRTLFEKICLEGFQAGLSWRTILTKRENFRAAFAGFDAPRVAEFGERDVERLLNDSGIVRHRGKIEATITNARAAGELAHEFGSLANYFWAREPDADEIRLPQSVTFSPTSTAVSTDLKRRGWRFVGPTTVFAFMQAMGLVNDHAHNCVVRDQVTRAREAFPLSRENPATRTEVAH